jgi:hypothetical protein
LLVTSDHFSVGPYSFTRQSGALLTVNNSAVFGSTGVGASTTTLNNFSMTSGTFRANGSMNVVISGSSVITTTGAMTLNENSIVSLNGGSLNLAGSTTHNLNSNSTLSVNGGALNLGTNATVNVGSRMNISGGYNVANNALLRAQSGGDILSTGFIDVGNGGTGFLTLVNAGSTLTAQSSTSDWGRGAGSNAVVELFADTDSVVSGLRIGTVDSAATMRVRGGTLTVNSTLEAGGGTASRTVQMSVQDSGTMTLNGTSTFNNQADLDFSSGTINVNQNATFNEGSRFDRTGGTLSIASGRKLIIDGGVYQDTTTGGQILSNGAGIEVKSPFARFNVSQYFDIGNGSLLVESFGQYNSPAGAITTDWAQSAGTLMNATVRSGGRINMGALRIANGGGATVNVENNGRIETNALAVGGAGTSNALINLNGGFLTVFGSASLGAGTQMTLNDPVGSSTTLGQFTQFLVDGTLTMTGNAVLFTQGENPNIAVDGLSMAGTSRIVMQPGAELFINYGAASAPLNSIRGLIQNGFNNGAWNGTAGISSTAAQIDSRLGVGYVNFPDPNFGSMTIKLTILGDTDLDGDVDFGDLLTLAQNYDATGATWQQGDFDYNATVAFPDLLALAQNYGLALSVLESATLIDIGGQAFVADWTLAQSMVPEPGAAIVASLLACAGLKRRRRVEAM